MAIMCEDIHIEIWAFLLFMVSILFYLTYDLEKHILLFLLLITFIIFDMGTYFSHIFDFTKWWKNIQGSMAEYSFNDSTIIASFSIMLVSILMILVGYHISGKFVLARKKHGIVRTAGTDAALEIVKGHAKLIFYVTSIGNLFYYLYKAFKVLTVSYVYLYTDYSEIWVLKMCSLVWYVAFYCYIATFPRRDEIKNVVAIYVICSVASLLTGSRGTAVVNILFIMFYYMIRQKYSDERWVHKHVVLKCMIALPIAMILLGIIGTLRSGNRVDNNIASYGLRLLSSQGESGLLLSETIENLEKFRLENVNFTFGKILNVFQENASLSNIFGLHYLGNTVGQTVERATFGNQFGYAVSYYKMKYAYLNGYSLGTYYLAEIWADFKWPGVIVLNLLLGFFIGKISKIAFSNFTIRCISFGLISQLLLIGRFSITNIILFFMSTAVWVTYIFFVADYNYHRRVN